MTTLQTYLTKKNKMEKKHFNFRLDKNLKLRAESYCKEQRPNVTLSYLLHKSLIKYLDNHEN